MGSMWLALLAIVMPGDPPKKPQRLWYTIGGLVTLPSFVTTPAAQVLGLQLVLMLLLLGMVGAALLLDCQARQFHFQLGGAQGAGLVLLFVGVVIELLEVGPNVSGHPTEVVFYVLASLFVGVMFAVQSTMNVRLAQDLGSPFRSATWCNVSALWGGAILLPCVHFIFHVHYDFHMKQWWIWLLVGMQSAFYTLTLTLLPKTLGYSSMFVLVLSGKLGSSVLADTLGAFQPAVPLSVFRLASVCTMLVGAILYSSPVSAVEGNAKIAEVSPKAARLGNDEEEPLTDATSDEDVLLDSTVTAAGDVEEGNEVTASAQAKSKTT